MTFVLLLRPLKTILITLGIMIKDPDSVYKPGARTKAGWIKIKPEYQKDLTDTCDLVILGGRVCEIMSYEQCK